MAVVSTIMPERRGLIHALNELKNHRVIAVCAPAGYGKTAAVAQWLDKDTPAVKPCSKPWCYLIT